MNYFFNCIILYLYLNHYLILNNILEIMKNKVLQYAKMVKTIMTPLKFQVNEEKPPTCTKCFLRI